MSQARPERARATYRGVRWRRDETGTTAWWNDGLGRWVRWYPGADAPPRPPRWEGGNEPPPPPRLVRPAWRSPYRIIPIVLVVLVLVVGIYQATRATNDPVRSEAERAERLVGKCLAQDGTAGGHAEYKAGPVPCALPIADVEVRSIRPGVPGSPACPTGSTPVQIPTIGVRYPHVLCVTPVPAGG